VADAPAPPRRRLKAGLVALGLSLAILVPLGWLWATSFVPNDYSAMDMGYEDLGGGPASVVPAEAGKADHQAGHSGHGQEDGRSVADLTGPRTGKPDVAVTLTARKQRFTLPSGESVDGFTVDGSSPGPLIRAKVGDLVQATLVNESVPRGASLHWHGIDVPNAEDGVAGVTQDAVPVGGRQVYRFRAAQAGTYWYHSHQVSSDEVRGGLFGTILIEPRQAAPGREVVAAIHTYDGRRSINGRTGTQRVDVPAGTRVRVRVLNTDNGVLRTGMVGAPYKVVAVDGRDLHRPTPVDARAYLLPAGGRADLEATVPPSGALRVDAGSAATSVTIGPAGSEPPGTALSDESVDLLSYGTSAPLGLDPEHADRRFEYRIGRKAGFLDGVPGLWWTINGHKYPDVPMYMVAEGDVVRMKLSNGSGQAHPMHLHGHHAVVLSRNGRPATGSPWWVDTLEVGDDETYEIAFRADNPGIWMDHCHNLPHASQGLMTHLAYLGVSTPYRIGGDHHNEPE
jgi:FtsP/CotA-like multicopper oxidase with cupredoxin domain